MDVTIDPNAKEAFQKAQSMDQEGNPDTDNSQQIIKVVFNPNVGMYDVQSDTGPSFATRRQEAFNALTQIAAQNKEFMNIGGDLLWKVADFPEAQELARRWRKIIPPNITGDAENPKTEALMHQASDHIQMLTAQLADLAKQVKDKEEDQRIKRLQLDLELKKATAQEARDDYEAETKRLTAVGNSGPGISVEQIQPIVKQIIRGMLNAGDPAGLAGELAHLPGILEGGTPIEPVASANEAGEGDANQQQPEQDSLPGVPGSRQASDGKHYVKSANGGYAEVAPIEAEPNA
jgi:hypothetical protein